MTLPSAATIVSDITTLQAQVAALQSSLPAPNLPTFSESGGNLVVTQNGATVATLPLPTATAAPATYAVATAYVAGQIINYESSAYIATENFTSSNLSPIGRAFGTDFNANKLELWCQTPFPGGFNFMGLYNASTTYQVGDAVNLAAGSTNIYVLTNTPTGQTTITGVPPSAGNTNWSLAMVSWPMNDKLVFDVAQNKTLDQVIVSLNAAIASIGNIPYDLSIFYPGVVPGGGGTTGFVANVCLPRAATVFPAGVSGQATCQVAPTNNVTLSIYWAPAGYTSGGSIDIYEIGFIYFAAGSKVGSFAFQSTIAQISGNIYSHTSPFNAAAGDTIQITGPVTTDSTFAGLAVTIPCTVAA